MRRSTTWIVALLVAALFVIAACGGGGGGAPGPNAYSVGGTIYGLTGTGLVLQNNGGDNLTINAPASTFTFATKIISGATYAVTVLTHPAGQTCTVNNGTGTVAGTNITNLSVICSVKAYSVGGMVSGLTGNGLVLRNNNADDLSINTNGTFTFPAKVADTAGYLVTVKTQPGGQACLVTNDTGTISGTNITNVSVPCSDNPYQVAGTVIGLTGTGLELQNNGRDDLIVSGNTITFPLRLADGDHYEVTVKTQPTGQLCAILNGSGTIQAAHVSNVEVDCGVNMGAVSPLYSANGGDWNDYVKNDGTTILTASNTASSGTETGGYRACLHSGEMRKATVTGKASCAGLTASDALDAFNWVCDDSTGAARFIATGLKSGKNLSDLINFAGPGWTPNSLVVFDGGTVYGVTASSVWWQNPVVVDNNGGSLAIAGTIYIVTSNPHNDYTIDASSVGLVIKPGVTLSGSAGGSYSSIIKVDGSTGGAKDFLWMEGSFDATGENGMYLNSVRFSVLRNVEVANANVNGYWYPTSNLYLFSCDNNKLTGIAASNSDTGVWLNGSQNNSLSEISASGNDTGLKLRSYNNVRTTHDNKFSGITVMGNNYGVYIASKSNVLTGVLASDNGTGFYIDPTSRNSLIGATASNNIYQGVQLWQTSYNYLSQVAAANNGNAVYLYQSWNNTLSDVAATNSQTEGLTFAGSSNNTFSGLLKVGNNGTADCSVTGGTAPGLDNACNSGAILSTGVTLTGSFIGKVASNDAVNTSDANGTASFSSITDWTGFENSFRGWGVDGGTFGSSDNRGACTTGTCRIWDWSLLSSDSSIRAVLTPVPSGNDTLTHMWNDNSTTTFLRHAVEILDDGIGNENVLCESNEACLYMPNIGAYQGHGSLVSAGTFTDGTITGVTLKRYDTNGY